MQNRNVTQPFDTFRYNITLTNRQWFNDSADLNIKISAASKLYHHVRLIIKFSQDQQILTVCFESYIFQKQQVSSNFELQNKLNRFSASAKISGRTNSILFWTSAATNSEPQFLGENVQYRVRKIIVRFRILFLTRSCSMSSIVDGYSEPVRSSVAFYYYYQFSIKNQQIICIIIIITIQKIKLCIKKTKSLLSNWGYTYLQF
ncbi:Hypothetical_protein [Hexamita inflata]|uniref:Hypothetical_protein n=1 Tax=Hexamita inflata TaxID=28002 RepID=A0AA86TJQ9_9EUKA|nr:Hypothetical protein HINF_LOCUS5402 [Hexamita inflata]